MRIMGLIVAALMILAFGTTVALGSVDVTFEVERDLDTDEMTSEVEFEFGVGLFDVALVWEHDFPPESDDSCELAVEFGWGPVELEFCRELLEPDAGELVTTFSFSVFEMEWEKDLGVTDAGDLTVTLDLDPVEIEWEKDLSKDGAGVITATYEISF